MIQDHQPASYDKFLGLFGMDEYDDSVPMGYFIDELNTITVGTSVKSRDGFGIDVECGPIIQHAVYRRQGEAARIIVLSSNGGLWDITTMQLLLNIPEMKGFAINYSHNRAIISPHNGETGLPGKFVYVYDGSTIRLGGAKPPTASFDLTVSADAGHIEKGKHIFAVVFETNTGFVSGPSPAKIEDFPGDKKGFLNNIPIGPAGTVARRIIASRAIQNYNGDEEGYEMFFVPEGRITNNTDISLTVDFYDADLQLSADYVYDLMEQIPAVVFIVPYGNRMSYGGPANDKNLVYMSNPLEPESVSAAAGFLIYDPYEVNGVKDATEFRDNFYVVKRNKTYTVRDNGYEPSTWKPVTIDSSIGGDLNSIARFYDTTGSTVEFWTISSPAGFFKFSGVYDAFPLSRNIKNIWDRINKKCWNLAQTMIDREKMLLYILVPVDGSTDTNAIIVGNFENGLTFEAIKWHFWGFPGFYPSSIAIDRDDEGESVLKIASLTGNIYRQEPRRRNDNGIRIPFYIQFALIAIQNHTITHCGGVGFRMKGLGDLKITLLGQDAVDNQVLAPVPLLCCKPGKEVTRLAHFQSEKVSLKIEMTNYGDWFTLNRANLFLNTIFNTRPIT
jgi:hypothetical protein